MVGDMLVLKDGEDNFFFIFFDWSAFFTESEATATRSVALVQQNSGWLVCHVRFVGVFFYGIYGVYRQNECNISRFIKSFFLGKEFFLLPMWISLGRGTEQSHCLATATFFDKDILRCLLWATEYRDSAIIKITTHCSRTPRSISNVTNHNRTKTKMGT